MAVPDEPSVRVRARVCRTRARHHLCRVPSDLVSSWLGAVEDFTKRELSKPMDRLPALSGMAERHGHLIKRRYLCGIWETCQSDLTCQLLWLGCRIAKRLVDYAPTWSWASIQGSVTFCGFNPETFRIVWEIGETELDPRGPNEYGSGGARMTITGPILWLVPHWAPDSRDDNCVQYYVQDRHGQRVLFRNELEPYIFYDGPEGNKRAFVDHMFPGRDFKDPNASPVTDLEFAAKSLVLLFAGVLQSGKGFAGLLLEPVGGRAGPGFRRVGFAGWQFYKLPLRGCWQDWEERTVTQQDRII